MSNDPERIDDAMSRPCEGRRASIGLEPPAARSTFPETPRGAFQRACGRTPRARRASPARSCSSGARPLAPGSVPARWRPCHRRRVAHRLCAGECWASTCLTTLPARRCSTWGRMPATTRSCSTVRGAGRVVGCEPFEFIRQAEFLESIYHSGVEFLPLSWQQLDPRRARHVRCGALSRCLYHELNPVALLQRSARHGGPAGRCCSAG